MDSPSELSERHFSVLARVRAAAALTVILIGVSLIAPGPGAEAIVLFSTTNAPDPPRAEAPPGSGGQWEGIWNGLTATAIAPHYFITARHAPGKVGDRVGNHITLAFFDDPGCDLRICRVDVPFTSYAPLYRADDEVGRDLVFFGNGVGRGPAVFGADGKLKGWKWGRAHIGWGANTVTTALKSPGLGDMLAFTFDARGTSKDPEIASHEGMVGGNDSGGGVFIRQNGVWKLAGIVYGAQCRFKVDPGADQKEFSAAIFDTRDLWEIENGVYKQVNPKLPHPVPAASFATRISSHIAWIDSIIGRAPGPAGPRRP